jgi:hypothetical protein
MGYKSDIQATRVAGTATSNVVVAPPVRLRGIVVASSGGGAGLVNLNTDSSSGGTNLLTLDVPNGDVINFSLPEDGILFPNGIYLSTATNVTAVTLLTDKFSGPNLTTTNILGFSKGGMPPRNKKNFRSTKSGAGMTQAGVKAYRRLNPGSKLKTAVTGKVKPGSKAAKRRKSFCARSAGQMKQFPKAAADPNSRLRQARRRWKC